MSTMTELQGPALQTPVQLCPDCGQNHLVPENHLYDYKEEVDDELTCHICLQPLLDPLDTPCGHTYCYQCLENFLQEQDFCPVDRQKLHLQQCRKSSLLVRNLLDKLSVVCPFTKDCGHVMQRCELGPHLQNRCPGFRKVHEETERKKKPQWHEVKHLKCDQDLVLDAPSLQSSSAPFSGTSAVGPLITSDAGMVNPAFEESEDDFHHRSSLVAETNTIEIHRDNPDEILGLRIVGGKDTPLGNIVIQEVLKNFLAARDGRLAPGDHILEVNHGNVTNVLHSHAIELLRRPCAVLHLVVMQEKGFSNRITPSDQGRVIQVTLLKRDRSEPLGIKLIRKPDECGIFVLDLLPGGLAAKDGKLQNNDKVLAINGQDLRHGTPETAAQIIQSSEARVNFVVMRQEDSSLREERKDRGQNGDQSSRINRRDEITHYHRHPALQKDLPGFSYSQPKVVSLKKDPRMSLGITISGGRDGKNHLPIYITSIQPVGCLYRDGRIKPGNILLSVNGVDLTQMTYSEAVSALKANAAHSNVQLKVLGTLSEKPEEEFADDLGEGGREVESSFSPLWSMWLNLPSALHWCHDIALHKTNNESWGFSIVGGLQESQGQQPFFIKTIVPGTPAHFDGHLKCGDEIVAVNGVSTADMNNSSLIPMLKLQKNKVTLTVVSWPGSLV